jgi:hypothetical protein
MPAAIEVARQQGCNPGGSVKILQIPAEMEKLIAKKWLNRVLSREEANEFDQEIAALRDKAAGITNARERLGLG